MNEVAFFRDVSIAILAAAVFAVPAYIFRIPILLSYLGAGVLLGPHLGLGVIKQGENISLLSDIGLVLLMFILGLEIDVGKLYQAGKAVIVNGLAQFIGCVVLGYAFFSLLGYKNADGRFELTYLSIAAALSSTLIVIKILSDRMELDTFLSRITLGILIIQDLWAIGFLAFQHNLKDMNPSALLVSLSGLAFLISFCWLTGKFILPQIFRRIAKQSELMLLVAMAWCFAMCGLAHYLKLSTEMGALLAGLMIASLSYHVDIAAKISSLRDFFITLFFVSLGLQIPKPSGEVIYLTGAITVFVLVSRILIMYPISFKMKYGNRASLLPALNLSQLSEFAIVLGALGYSYGHIRLELMSAFIMTFALTSLISSFVIPSSHEIYKRANVFLEFIGLKDRIVADGDSNGDDTLGNGADVVLLGFFRDASSLLQELINRHSHSATERIMVVDFNPEAHQKLIDQGIKCKYGDISSEATLRSLRLEKAKLFVCTIPDNSLKGTTNLQLLSTLKKMSPHADVVVTAATLESAKEMYANGADYVFVPRLITAHYLADVLERMSLGEKVSIKTNAIAFLNQWNEVLP